MRRPLGVLKGNLAPEGCVAKVTGIKHHEITGPARVFEREEDSSMRSSRGRSRPRHPGDRYEGRRRARHARDAPPTRRLSRGTRRFMG